MTHVNDNARLATAMAEVARSLERSDDVADTWTQICRLAVDRLDGVEHAGITIVRRGRPETPASSDDLPERVDALQYETHEGPCLSALADHQTLLTGDLAEEGKRWPSFGPRAVAETGVHSMVSYQLFAAGDTLGALNFYARDRDAFDDDTVAAGAVFAAHAALALAQAKERERAVHLERALDSNRMIGAACGILMSQYRITEQEAFDLLRQFSQNHNRKLREIADDVVHTGTLPDDG